VVCPVACKEEFRHADMKIALAVHGGAHELARHLVAELRELQEGVHHGLLPAIGQLV
jgi:hypothetical protein